MNFVKAHPEYGIIIRRDALASKAIATVDVIACFEGAHPYDQSNQLLSFGPHFGREAANNIVASLERTGLIYVEDFFVFAADAPPWCQFGACCGPTSSGTDTLSE
jgi:hypothetical protein